MKVLQRRGWNLDEVCLSFIGYEGGKAHVVRQKKIVKDIVGKHGGILVGKGPGALYDQKKFDTPTSATSCSIVERSVMSRDGSAVVEAAAAVQECDCGCREGVRAAWRPGWIMCHLSHLSLRRLPVLHLRFKHDGVDPLGQYEPLKNAIQQAFVDSGGTLSHHHAVGTEHAAWLEQDISAPGVHMIEGLFSAMDPNSNFNPGKIIAK